MSKQSATVDFLLLSAILLYETSESLVMHNHFFWINQVTNKKKTII